VLGEIGLARAAITALEAARRRAGRGDDRLRPGGLTGRAVVSWDSPVRWP
jgi:hypothetical protein